MTTDMRLVIVPKSDQQNADDFVGGPRTITITRVEIRPGTEQPTSIFFEGDNNKPWKPCKSMARVMVLAWGPDAKEYAGKSLTLYNDPSVKWGGLAVGGIRISHMSHIPEKREMALTATKGQRKIHVIYPLAKAPAKKTVSDYKAEIDAMDSDQLYEWMIANASMNNPEKAGPYAIWQHATERGNSLANQSDKEES